MSDKVIPILDQRSGQALPKLPAQMLPPTGLLADALGRPLRDLRISVTDRCNFRCSYCMPKQVFDKHYEFLPHSDLLSFEEITRLARVFVAHGVQKLRLTGGEPLLRRHIEALIEMLSEIRTPEGLPLDLTLTTNGSLLARKAASLKAAGLQRVTVSLDGLDDAVFQRMNDVGFPVAEVLAGIEAAQAAGLGPIKVNMVVKCGVNDQEILPMARHFRGSGVTLRFIEYMDVGATNGWRMDEVLPSSEVLARLREEFDLLPLSASVAGETAERWSYDSENAGGQGEIGLISSVTQAFCGDCNRARLSTEGKLYTCLFAHRGHDLRALLRSGASEAELSGAIGLLWGARADRYSQLRASGVSSLGDGERRVEMHYIGG
ncbi:GTP 3',8-cyclase MoaA [Paucibacter sp. TC2R-5]|uniref:GTP 3',8-cyclase MoaA n=1 Tax=Paucibacter sp. TC2R-5 TaxID=2893555 RepID=UPI0021E4C8A0|nr:GTP 3',8-cyclase MoaA [Paucibacter sp. TC2R-5]MCV2357770.1 GTP 3',8-cyclase MoaA [Paucibacter sp. TC2R-5]